MSGVKTLGVAFWTAFVLIVGFVVGYIRGFDDAYDFSANAPQFERTENQQHEE